MKASKVIFALFIAQAYCLFIPQTNFCQPVTSRGQITVAALAGDWAFGNGLMLTYLDQGTGNYSHSGNIFAMKYVIKADGSFVYKFAARYGINTIREWGSGTVVVSRDIITFKFDQGTAEKYKFVALETDTNCDSVLTLTQINDSSQLARCGHNKGYFNCTGRQEWTLRRRS